MHRMSTDLAATATECLRAAAPGANTLSADAPGADELLIAAEAAQALADGCVGDPFALLGPHPGPADTIVRAYLPPAEAVDVVSAGAGLLCRLQPLQTPGLFAGRIAHDTSYRLRIHWPGGVVQETEDPYAFGLLLGELDLHLFAEGNHLELGRCLGAQVMSIGDVAGVRFAVWAPNAQACLGGRRLQRLGWAASCDAQARRGGGLGAVHSAPVAGHAYTSMRFSGRTDCCRSRPIRSRSQVEPPPRTASVVADPAPLRWTDSGWLAGARAQRRHDALTAVDLRAARRIVAGGCAWTGTSLAIS